MPARFTRLHGACNVNGTGVKQQLLGQRGLSRIGVGNNGKGAAATGFLFNTHAALNTIFSR